MKALILCAVLLSGCSTLDAYRSVLRDKTDMAYREALKEADYIRCHRIIIGTWIEVYGNNPTKRKAWRADCLTPGAGAEAPVESSPQ